MPSSAGTRSSSSTWRCATGSRPARPACRCPTTVGEFWRQVEWMGLQRHLKVLGIFCRLKHRDGKPAYSADLPRFFDYAHRVAVALQRAAPAGATARAADGRAADRRVLLTAPAGRARAQRGRVSQPAASSHGSRSGSERGKGRDQEVEQHARSGRHMLAGRHRCIDRRTEQLPLGQQPLQGLFLQGILATNEGRPAMPSPASAAAYIVSMWVVLSAGRCGTGRRTASPATAPSATGPGTNSIWRRKGGIIVS